MSPMLLIVMASPTGHLLFEMMCGYELTTLSPSDGDWGNVRNKDQLEVRN